MVARERTIRSQLIEDHEAGRRAVPTAIARLRSITGDGMRSIACAGTHDGLFFDFMLATGRHVFFEEVHILRVRGGRVVEDHVAIDMRAIIRKLAMEPLSRCTVGP